MRINCLKRKTKNKNKEQASPLNSFVFSSCTVTSFACTLPLLHHLQALPRGQTPEAAWSWTFSLQSCELLRPNNNSHSYLLLSLVPIFSLSKKIFVQKICLQNMSLPFPTTVFYYSKSLLSFVWIFLIILTGALFACSIINLLYTQETQLSS